MSSFASGCCSDRGYIVLCTSPGSVAFLRHSKSHDCNLIYVNADTYSQPNYLTKLQQISQISTHIRKIVASDGIYANIYHFFAILVHDLCIIAENSSNRKHHVTEFTFQALILDIAVISRVLYWAIIWTIHT